MTDSLKQPLWVLSLAEPDDSQTHLGHYVADLAFPLLGGYRSVEELNDALTFPSMEEAQATAARILSKRGVYRPMQLSPLQAQSALPCGWVVELRCAKTHLNLQLYATAKDPSKVTRDVTRAKRFEGLHSALALAEQQPSPFAAWCVRPYSTALYTTLDVSEVSPLKEGELPELPLAPHRQGDIDLYPASLVKQAQMEAATVASLKQVSETRATPAEPDMLHPKIQGLLRSRSRLQIELGLAEELLKNPGAEFSAMSMEYWGPLHDLIAQLQEKAARYDWIRDNNPYVVKVSDATIHCGGHVPYSAAKFGKALDESIDRAQAARKAEQEREAQLQARLQGGASAQGESA